MKSNFEESILGKLPVDIFQYILNLLTPQLKIDTLQQLRLVCKELYAIINSDDFLKLHAPVLYLKKQNLQDLLNKNKVIGEQIEDWLDLKTKVQETFNELYINLPQIKPVINLLEEIQNTPLPASFYFSTLRNILHPRYVRLAFAAMILVVTAAIIYSVMDIPLAKPYRDKSNKLEKELLDEGCTFSSGSHGSVWIEKCNDTVKADEWRYYRNEADKYLVGPVILDTIGGGMLICAVIYFIIRYRQERHNHPSIYGDLTFANLTPQHHAEFTNIRNNFRDLNNNHFLYIKDVATGLKGIIETKELPTIIEEEILILQEQYKTIVLKLDAEIAKLREYEKNNKLVLSTKLADGTLKTSFRSSVYSFFSECKDIRIQQQTSDTSTENNDIELGLTRKNPVPNVEKVPLMYKHR